MKYEEVYSRLAQFVPPSGWRGQVFLLPEPAMRAIYEHLMDAKVRKAIELGTGFGATSCVMAAAMEEMGAGRVVTVDRYLHQPVNVTTLMQHCRLQPETVEVVADLLGYNWYLADVIRQQTRDGHVAPLYDFCLLDGAHEWAPDALAFHLVAKLLKDGAWIAVDDLDFNLRMIPNWQESHGDRTDRELDTFQMAMVYELAIRQHPDFGGFKITHHGRIGWARKRSAASPAGWRGWIKRRLSL